MPSHYKQIISHGNLINFEITGDRVHYSKIAFKNGRKNWTENDFTGDKVYASEEIFERQLQKQSWLLLLLNNQIAKSLTKNLTDIGMRDVI